MDYFDNETPQVMWEPFIEPWMFELELNRKYDRDIAGSSSFMTDIGLKSTSQLNLNLTEPLIEVSLYTFFGAFQWPKIYLASMVFDDIHID